MLVPGKGYQNSRLSDVETRGERMLRTKEARHSREPQAFNPRRGKFLAIAAGSITRDTPGLVSLVFKSGTKYRYCRNPTDNEIVQVTASAFMLNDADSIAADTALVVEHMGDNHWEIVNAWCEVRDWELEDEETSETPGDEGGESQSSMAAAAITRTNETIAAATAANQDFGSSGGHFQWQV